MYKEKYIEELKRHFGVDERRIKHALKVLNIAEEIMQGEKVDAFTQQVVTITAILHDIGIKAAEQKYNSSAGCYQELEGPSVAMEIMRRHAEHDAVIDRVCYIIGGHHTVSKIDGIDFQIIWEADLFVNIEEDRLHKKSDRLEQIINKNFRTATGRQIAEKSYLV